MNAENHNRVDAFMIEHRDQRYVLPSHVEIVEDGVTLFRDQTGLAIAGEQAVGVEVALFVSDGVQMNGEALVEFSGCCRMRLRSPGAAATGLPRYSIAAFRGRLLSVSMSR
jgi:hypothetical protein